MDLEEKISRLRLIRSQQVGPVMFRSLLKYYKTPQAALEALPEKAREGGRKKPIKIYSRAEAEKEFEALEKFGAEFVFLGEEKYPELLSFFSDSPVVFSILGNKAFLKKPHIGVVGTRNASINGKNMARKLCHDFVLNGFSVCSGMALGIDAAAHEGALFSASKEASTTAVLGTGIDIAYPATNRRLYEEIKEKGLIISEYPLGSKPQPSHFPQRNRIISGFSKALVVIEAALNSGSLITANKALEQGKDVFAVPASPLDPRASGVNYLIKTGAPLVERYQDVLNLIREPNTPEYSLFEGYRPSTLFQDSEENTANGFETKQPSSDLFETQALNSFDEKEPNYGKMHFSDKQREDLLSLLDASEIEIDTLVEQTDFSTGEISVLLVELELAGKIERLPGNKIIRISSY